ncbi:MAG: 2-C-methyl-D-erythritol 4-phosphate cytidylyltransferase, partial [Actinomycetaceae bacterium]|nr:2-C-methyl-D-erythritol 4-phosphate cytidylyltransferase [Actinomycetaceae bacterium]
MPVWAICTAAGSGQRLGGGAPKALLPIGGQPMVVLAVRPFLALPDLQKLIVTAPPDSLEQFRAVLEPVDPRIVVVPGRADRQGSVRAGIEALGDIGPGILLVHDAARPFTPMAVICRVIDAVRAGASAVVPVVPVVDKLRTFLVDGCTEFA